MLIVQGGAKAENHILDHVNGSRRATMMEEEEHVRHRQQVRGHDDDEEEEVVVDAQVREQRPVPPAPRRQKPHREPPPVAAAVRVRVHVVGLLIGKGGAAIKSIQSRTGARVVVDRGVLPEKSSAPRLTVWSTVQSSTYPMYLSSRAGSYVNLRSART